MVESGIDGFVGFYWNGVLAPTGTPAAIVTRLNAIINEGLRTEAMRASLAKLGMDPMSGTPQEFGTQIAAEHRGRAVVARAAHL